jgi:ribA/ribD-fused uncharacterized protein
MTIDTIPQFSGKYRFLSNFWVERDGKSVEHRFQANKTLDPDERKAIMLAATPADAKALGRKATLRSDWETIKVPMMAQLVALKFTSDIELKNLLLSTNNMTLQEGNTWKDTFWGVDLSTGKGQNHLGTILMSVRETLRFR